MFILVVQEFSIGSIIWYYAYFFVDNIDFVKSDTIKQHEIKDFFFHQLNLLTFIFNKGVNKLKTENE